MKRFNRIFTVIIFIFLYIPMIVLAVASFNKGTDVAVFKGFTFHQYAELFRDGTLLTLLRNSLFIAVLSSLVVSLALLFAFAGALLRIKSILGFWTLLIAHITFNLPYIILNVMPKLSQMDPDLTEAALDLGCTPVQAFFKVVLHEIMPGIVSGALMAFTMSLDDFVISYFVTGSSFVTLPVEIYNYTKKPIQPKIYALFTLMFVVILIMMSVMNLLQARDKSKRQHSHLNRRRAG